MSKKILFLSGGSYVSGLEVVTLHLIQGLKEQGYEIHSIINGWNDGNYRKKLEALGVTVYEVKLGWLYLKKPLWTLDTLINYPGAYFKTKKIIKKFDPDIFQFCNFGMTILLSPLIKKNAVFNLQETHLPNKKNLFLFKLLNKKINYFTAVSNHIVNVLKNVGIPSDKIELIYNGIPPVNNDLLPSTINLISQPVLNFAIIGQVVPWKGHENLVDAAEILIEKGVKNFKVQIYGNDNTAFGKELKVLIKAKALDNYFVWKGFVNNQDEVYKDCSVVIIPSLSGEPCSLSIIESMTRGKGVIVSDRGGNPELVQNKENGLVFKAESKIELSNCMYEMISNREFIAVLAEKAQQKALIKYTYKAMTNAYISIYNKL